MSIFLYKTLALAPLSSDPLEFLGYLELCWKYKKVKFLNFSQCASQDIRSMNLKKLVSTKSVIKIIILKLNLFWFFSAEHWYTQFACCVYFYINQTKTNSVVVELQRLKLTVWYRAAKFDTNLEDVKKPLALPGMKF